MQKQIGPQIKFQQIYNTALKELKILEKNPSETKIENIRKEIKQLDKCIANIEQTLFASRNINKCDAEKRINACKNQKIQLKTDLDRIELNFQKSTLFQHKTGDTDSTPNNIKSQNRKLALELQGQTKNITRVLGQTQDVMGGAKMQLIDQGKVIGTIQEDADEAETNLTMVDQFMRMISNRNLLTKIILLFLVVFLAIADIAIILLKIS